MEMEHINENTIRVLIKGEDLAARGFTFLDLLGNKDEIESFFYSILEEVDIEEEFKGSEAVTFQVMPKDDGLELFISKSNPDDLSETFEEFRRERAKEDTTWLNVSDEEDEEDEEEDELDAFLRKEASKYAVAKDSEKTKGTEKIPNKPYVAVFEFLDFELVIWLANEVMLDQVCTKLYSMNNRYFLEIQFLNPDISKNEINNSIAHISEFSRQSTITAPVLMEHGEVVIENDALETIRSHFSS